MSSSCPVCQVKCSLSLKSDSGQAGRPVKVMDGAKPVLEDEAPEEDGGAVPVGWWGADGPQPPPSLIKNFPLARRDSAHHFILSIWQHMRWLSSVVKTASHNHPSQNWNWSLQHNLFLSHRSQAVLGQRSSPIFHRSTALLHQSFRALFFCDVETFIDLTYCATRPISIPSLDSPTLRSSKAHFGPQALLPTLPHKPASPVFLQPAIHRRPESPIH